MYMVWTIWASLAFSLLPYALYMRIYIQIHIVTTIIGLPGVCKTRKSLAQIQSLTITSAPNLLAINILF